MRRIEATLTGIALAAAPIAARASDFTGVVMTFWTLALLGLAAVLALVYRLMPATLVWKVGAAAITLPLLAALAFSGQGLFPRYPVAGTAYWASWCIAAWLVIRILTKRPSAAATDAR